MAIISDQLHGHFEFSLIVFFQEVVIGGYGIGCPGIITLAIDHVEATVGRRFCFEKLTCLLVNKS